MSFQITINTRLGSGVSLFRAGLRVRLGAGFMIQFPLRLPEFGV